VSASKATIDPLTIAELISEILPHAGGLLRDWHSDSTGLVVVWWRGSDKGRCLRVRYTSTLTTVSLAQCGEATVEWPVVAGAPEWDLVSLVRRGGVWLEGFDPPVKAAGHVIPRDVDCGCPEPGQDAASKPDEGEAGRKAKDAPESPSGPPKGFGAVLPWKRTLTPRRFVGLVRRYAGASAGAARHWFDDQAGCVTWQFETRMLAVSFDCSRGIALDRYAAGGSCVSERVEPEQLDLAVRGGLAWLTGTKGGAL
jgi:hypothetical protein